MLRIATLSAGEDKVSLPDIRELYTFRDARQQDYEYGMYLLKTAKNDDDREKAFKYIS